MDDATDSGPRCRMGLVAMAGLAGLVQLAVLYWPSGSGTSLLPGADKIAHTLVFAAPVLLALWARVSAQPVLVLAVLHAPVSEIIQWRLLAHRTGDPWDVVADLMGVGLGWLTAAWVRRKRW